jgi:hypothetical protein
MQKLYKLLHISFQTRQLLIDASVILTLVRLGLWLLPFRIWQRLLMKIVRTDGIWHGEDRVSEAKIVWAVEIVSRYQFGSVKCLARALTTQILFAKWGYDAQLHIGVAKSEVGDLEAHAWVESEGKVAIGKVPNLSRFQPLFKLERERI